MDTTNLTTNIQPADPWLAVMEPARDGHDTQPLAAAYAGQDVPADPWEQFAA